MNSSNVLMTDYKYVTSKMIEKYLTFLSSEITITLNSKRIPSGSMDRIDLELKKFSKWVDDNRNELKNSYTLISDNLSWNYSFGKQDKSENLMLFSIFTLGIWSIILNFRIDKRNRALLTDLRRNLEKVQFEIR